MARSLRWRLQVWYTAVLVAVVGGFAGLLYVELRSSRLGEVDRQLLAAAHYLDAALRAPPEEISSSSSSASVPGSSTTKRYLHLGQSIFFPTKWISRIGIQASQLGHCCLKLVIIAMIGSPPREVFLYSA